MLGSQPSAKELLVQFLVQQTDCVITCEHPQSKVDFRHVIITKSKQQKKNQFIWLDVYVSIGDYTFSS